MLYKEGNLKGNLMRSRPYDGQPHTDHGERGKHEVCNITMRDLRDCFIRAVAQSTGPGKLYTESSKGEYAKISEGDLYKISWDGMDIIAVQQNLTCEVEKIMGIFPNVPGMEEAEDIAHPLNIKSDEVMLEDADEGEVWAPTLMFRWLQQKRMDSRVLQQQWIRTSGGPACGGGSSEWRNVDVVTT